MQGHIRKRRIHVGRVEEWIRLEKRPDYMMVPAAIKELEKIEMVRLTDNKYRLDHAVSSLQKLLDKRDAKQKDELWNAVMKSEKSYDEILQMII